MTTEYSIQKMVSDGTLSTIALGIQYLQRNDVYLRIAGVETPQSGATSGYTWSFLDNNTIRVLPIVPTGVEVVVYRRTDLDEMYNIYSQNAQFDESTIDENNQQLLYIAQEYFEQGVPAQLISGVEYAREDTVNMYYRLKLSDGSYTAEFAVPKGGAAGFEALRRSYADAGLTLVDGSFETGGTLSSTTDVLLLNVTAKAYAWTGAFPKVVAPGTDPTLSGSGYVPRTGVVLRSELSGDSGPSLVGVCQDVTALRALTGLTVGRKVQLLGYYSDTPNIGGGTLLVTSDTSSADNGGTVFVTADGIRLKRERKARLKASDFGVRGDWNGTTGTDNRSRIEVMIAASNSSQPWEIDLDGVGVSTIQINSKDNWKGFVTGSVVNISAKPVVGSTDEKDTAGGVLPTFKITNCNNWKLKGGHVDNRYREAFWVENCNKFVNECDVLGSGLNNNLRPNYYRYCRSFTLKGFRHEGTSEKPATGYYAHCNNINLWDCSNFKLLDFEVEDTGSNGVYVGSNCKDFTIAQYAISGNAMSGIQLAWSSFGRFPYRGTIGAGVINGNRADGIDVNNTSGSIVRIQLVIEGVQSVNNGYNDDGTVTADGSGIGTFKNIKNVDIIGCHTEDPARAGVYFYNCVDVNIVGGSVKKEKTTNNLGEGVYIEGCTRLHISDIDVSMAAGMEALKLYGQLKDITIGKKSSFSGIVSLPIPSASVSYNNVVFDGAVISTPSEIQGYVPFKNTKVVSSVNGLRAFKPVIDCDIESTSGIGLVFGAANTYVSGGNIKGAISGTYCSFSRCLLERAFVTGGTGPASDFVGALIGSKAISNTFVSTGGANGLRVGAQCTKTIQFGNTHGATESLSGTFDINY